MALQKTLIVIGGPTASGKTALAIELARHFGTEIVSADSRQIYREMTIGTAKPTPEELAAVPHHFIDSHSIHDTYSAGQYERDALVLLERLFSQHDVVVAAGGSGLYLKALMEGLDDFPEIPPEVEHEVEALFAEKGLPALQEQVARADPAYYEVVDRHNPARLLRALKVIRATGRPFSAFRKSRPAPRPWRQVPVLLMPEREALYARINRRAEAMIETGLLDEVRRLYPYRHLRPLQTVGYQEFFPWIEGSRTLEEAIRLFKRNTRRYAKRQMT
ncbi:MAG: tRNA (adenosine(37)-N6)-dimethylallyltransferase MiaA, partial [Bacteroidetes bacterium]